MNVDNFYSTSQRYFGENVISEIVFQNFRGITSLKSKYFIGGITKHLDCIYILDQRLIVYKMVYKQTSLILMKNI